MLPRRGQLLSRLPAKPSFAGTGLLERMRSTTFALLGITAAMGLGLVAIVSQQGWPVLPAAPLPGLGDDRAEVHGAKAVAERRIATAPPRSTAAHEEGAVAGRGATPSQPAASRLSGSRQLETAPAAPGAPPAAAGSPAPAPVDPAPVGQPPSESPAVTAPAAPPAGASAPPASTAAVNPPVDAGEDDAGAKDKYRGEKDKYKSERKVGKPPRYEPPKPTPAPAPAPVADPKPEQYDAGEVEAKEESTEYRGKGSHGYGKLGK